jgi:hypothetical protein
MRRAIAREQDDRRTQDRFLSTLVIAAAIIAVVRLAREDISTPRYADYNKHAKKGSRAIAVCVVAAKAYDRHNKSRLNR